MVRRFLPICVLLLSLIVATGGLSAAENVILPRPQQMSLSNKTLDLTSVNLQMPCWTTQWTEWLESNGVKVSSNGRTTVKGAVVTSIPGVPEGNDEGYMLKVGPRGIEVEATSEKGIYWALMTLEQMASPAKKGLKVTQGEITDWPAFPYRGYLMDVGRSYISTDELKREIENLAKFKINVFHWHLTENQAWRLESKIFPMIVDSVNIERQPGQYYTLEEAKDLVQFAKDHNVLLIPELDMPGHSAAFQRTFRHDMQSPEGMKILKLLIEEACETFDVPYLHIGTDEVRFTNPDFVPEMVEFVRSKGKKVISWMPGWKYQPGEIDMMQMWGYRGKPTPGIPAIDSRLHYLNHFDVFADIVALYRSNIYGQPEAGNDVAGVEIAIWNDRFVEDERDNIAQNNLYAVALAMAERAWQGGGSEYFDNLGTNIAPEDTQDFKDFADFERRLLWHKDNTLADEPIPYVKQTDVKWRITDAFPNGGDLTKVFPPETEGPKAEYIYNDTTYGTAPATGAGIYLRHVWGATVPTFYSDPQPNHTAYAYTWVYSPKDQEVGLQVEFQNYSRSEKDLAPDQGKWDYKESRIWLNDKEILPPVWTATHRELSNEIPLGNENFAVRKPILVNLHKGWNKLMLKLPVGSFNNKETRLTKWMFTAVFTTPDGRHAAPGLIYSPDKKK